MGESVRKKAEVESLVQVLNQKIGLLFVLNHKNKKFDDELRGVPVDSHRWSFEEALLWKRLGRSQVMLGGGR